MRDNFLIDKKAMFFVKGNDVFLRLKDDFSSFEASGEKYEIRMANDNFGGFLPNGFSENDISELIFFLIFKCNEADLWKRWKEKDNKKEMMKLIDSANPIYVAETIDGIKRMYFSSNPEVDYDGGEKPNAMNTLVDYCCSKIFEIALAFGVSFPTKGGVGFESAEWREQSDRFMFAESKRSKMGMGLSSFCREIEKSRIMTITCDRSEKSRSFGNTYFFWVATKVYGDGVAIVRCLSEKDRKAVEWFLSNARRVRGANYDE